MAQLIAVVILVVFVKILKQEGVLDKARTPQGQKYLIPILGVLSWTAMLLLLWGIWHIYLIFDEVIQSPLSLSTAYSIGELALIAIGIAFAYHTIITISESGTTKNFRSAFLQMLRFQPVKIKSDEKKPTIDLNKLMKAEQKEKEFKSIDKDFEKYFGD